ncbi:CsbD family protein [Agrobacterium sp. 22094]|uniref:CsbD family protein n=1 Tax=Agrobacterium sp. 22094 TaxID=3453872 RepID=UPI003A5AA0A7
MGSTSDKIAGKANEVAGKVKQGVGSATGNDRMRAEGAAQETKGKVQTAAGKAKDVVKDTVDRM